MDNAATRWIAEGIADSWNIISAPLAGGETLCHLFSNVVSEDGELGAEVMVNANDFFPKIGRSISAANERAYGVSNVGGRCGEDACLEQSSGIRIDHARWNHIARKLPTRGDSRRGRLAGTIREQSGLRDLRIRPVTCPRRAEGWNKYRVRCRCGKKTGEVTAIGRGVRNVLISSAALNELAPFHVIEEEGPLLVWVVKLAESYRTADIEPIYIQP